MGGLPRSASGVPRATLCYAPVHLSTLVQEPLPGDWPRVRRDRARHRSAVAADRDAGGRRRGPRRPRARSRPPPHHRIPAPGSGFEADLNAFRFWAIEPGRRGPGRLLRPRLLPRLHARLPVRPVAGRASSATPWAASATSIKVPPILADLAIGWLAWSMVRELGGRDRLALARRRRRGRSTRSPGSTASSGDRSTRSASSSCCWACATLWRDRPERAAIFTVIAALIKPQLGILDPARRGRDDPARPVADRATRRRPTRQRSTRASSIGCGRGSDGPITRADPDHRAWPAVSTVVLCLPFGLSVLELTGGGAVHRVRPDRPDRPSPPAATRTSRSTPTTPGRSSPATSATAWPTPGCGCATRPVRPSNAASGVAVFGPMPAVVVGVGAAASRSRSALVLWRRARHPDRLTLLVALAVLALAFFVVPTRVHERYGFPFFAFGAILFADLAGGGGSRTSCCRSRRSPTCTSS